MRPYPRLATLALGLLLLLGAAAAVRAQAPAVPQGAPPVAESAAPSDVEALIQVLEDPARREALLRRLKAAETTAQPGEAAAGGGAAAGPTAAPAGETAPPGGETAPAVLADAGVDDVLARTLDFFEARIAVVVSVLLKSAASIRQLPELVTWLVQEGGNPASRARVYEVAATLAAVLVWGVALAIGAHVLLGRSRRRLSPPASAGPLLRLGGFLLRLLAELAPLALFLGATWIAAQLIEMSFYARLIGRQAILAIAIGRSVAALRRALLHPLDKPGRHLGISNGRARQLDNWTKLIAALGIYGYFGLWIALVLGLPWELHGLLEHLLFFVVTLLLVGMVLRFRVPVRDGLLRLAADPEAVLWRRLLPLRAIADYWHVAAIAWIAVHFLAWALKLPDGFAWLARNNLLTLLTLVVARLAAVAVTSVGPAEAAGAAEQGEEAEPQPEAKAKWRKPVRVLIDLAAVLALLLIWSPGLNDWLRGPIGERMLASLLKVAVVLAFAAMIWALVRHQLERYVSATDAEGNLIHGRRARTLATVTRNVLFVVLGVFSGFLVLGELGVDTTPLLAGAGVIGIAVGFGSQKLVQDIINGLFVLLSDTLRVGDVVDLGGKVGVVEAMSMRAITLRGYDGHVHTIPYSSVDVVTNMTKDFSYWVLDVGVAYREDVDQVTQVLTDIAAQLQREWPFRRLILEPLEIAGVDAFGDSAVIIKARIKTRPGEQWRVGRELNRRIKRRFDELGIEIPFPHQTVYFGTDKEGVAPPLRIEMRRRELQQAAEEEPAARIRTVGGA
jgi:small conductance mechanosensitive channel